MTKREIIKKIAGIVTQIGTGAIVNGIVKSNVPMSRLDVKIAVGVASFAIGGIVANSAVNYMDTTVDEIFDIINQFKNAA